MLNDLQSLKTWAERSRGNANALAEKYGYNENVVSETKGIDWAFYQTIQMLDLLIKKYSNSEPSATIAANPMLGGAKPEQFCTCSKGKGLDTDADGVLYCIDCGLPVQVQNCT